MLRIALLLATNLSAASPEKCRQTRCALDIGSSAIKAQIALVDSCTQQVLKTLYPAPGDKARREIPFGELKSGTHRVKELGDAGAAALKAFTDQAKVLKAEPCRAVATAAFRNSPEGAALAKTLSEKSGVPVTVLSAEKEGQLELFGTLARADLPTEKRKIAVVWGLGSTSQQWTPADGSPPVDLDISANGFRQRVLAEIKHSSAASPNPLSTSEVKAARELAEKIASSVPVLLVKKLKGAVVIGIGGVLNLSVKPQVGAKETLKTKDVTRAIEARIGKADGDKLFLDEPHAPSQLTNLILVEAFLKKLGIREVLLVETNLTDGALVYPALWNQ